MEDSKPSSRTVLVAVLAGGRGQRSADPSLPKVLQELEGKTLLERHLELFEKNELVNVCLLLGHGASSVIAELDRLRPQFSDLCITHQVDEDTDTQLTALQKCLTHKGKEFQFFLVVMGDILINANLRFFINTFKNSKALGSTLVHPNLHPEESDVFVYSRDKSFQEIRFKGNALLPLQSPALSMVGVSLFRDTAVQVIRRSEDEVTKGLIEPLFRLRELEVECTVEYFQDTGTPLRLQKARRDIVTGSFHRRLRGGSGAIFLDRDGTLIPNVGSQRKDIRSEEISASLVLAIREANDLGIPVFVVTNQPGIAKGEITYEDFLKTQYDLQTLLANQGALIDDFEFCSHHPDSGFEGEIKELKISCECRKPKPGMILALAKRHGVKLDSSYVIGDSVSDEQAAISAGARFLRCIDPDQDPSSTPRAIYTALEVLTL